VERGHALWHLDDRLGGNVTRVIHTQGIAVLVGLLLSVVQAHPSIAAPEWPSGRDYTFRSFAYDKNGRDVCYEHWHFGADGIKTITHDKQILRMKYKIEHDKISYYLVEEKVDQSQAEDCLSTLRADLSAPRRYLMARMVNGSFILIKHTDDPARMPLMVADLYGQADTPINPVADDAQRRCEEATKGPAPFLLAQKPIEKFDECIAAEANKWPVKTREAVCALGRSGGASGSTVEVYMAVNGRCRTDYE
jgi:hypothetical protein